jgi:hypothetical protein
MMRIMIMPAITLLVLLAVLAIEIGWLCRC